MEKAIRREIFRLIVIGALPHGDFLAAFATAFLRADEANAALLSEAADRLRVKYQLDEELGYYLQRTPGAYNPGHRT